MLEGLGYIPNEEDSQPKLKWESSVWVLSQRVSGGFGVDIQSFVSIAGNKGWNLDIALELLEFKRIEEGRLKNG